MTDTDWRLVAEHLEEQLGMQRLTTQQLARKAGVDRKTVDRLRAGHPVRAQTLNWIEQALKASLRSGSGRSGPALAPAQVGGYRRDTFEDLVGSYLCYRRSFDRPAQLIASEVRIFWDEAAGHLRFSDHQRNRTPAGRAFEYHFDGDVLIPPKIGVVNLVVRSGDGRIRVIATSMPREASGVLTLKGFLLTLNEIADIGYYPVTSPICLARQAAALNAGELERDTGVLTAEDPRYAWASDMLDGIEARLLPGR